MTEVLTLDPQFAPLNPFFETLPEQGRGSKKAWQAILNHVFKDREIPTVAHRSFPIWRRVNLGNYDKEQLKSELVFKLRKRGEKIYYENGLDLIKHDFNVSSIWIDLPLVLVTAVELGCDELGTIAELYLRAYCGGLQAVPAEVGPQLVLQCPEAIPPYDTRILMGMTPIYDWANVPQVLQLYRSKDKGEEYFSGELYFSHGYALPGELIGPPRYWVFTPVIGGIS